MLYLRQKNINQYGMVSCRKYGNAVLPLLISSLIGVQVNAQAAEETSNFELSPEQLFAATVTSVSKTSEKLMDAPAAVFVLTNEDIMRSGATSIPEALRLVPGVEVAQVNANSWAVSIRGFNGTLANKLLVLIDGRTVYDPLFSGVYWDIQDTILEDIDRIEVIRGPGATLWGANAVNGVINIITKKAQDTQGNLVSATYGTQDQIVEGRNGVQLGDNGFFRSYAKYVDHNDEQTMAGHDARDRQFMGRGGFRSDWKGTGDANDEFTFQGDGYIDNTGDLRLTPQFTNPTTVLMPEDIYANGANMLGRWTRTLSADSKFTLQTYVDHTLRDQLVLKDNRTTFDIDTQYEMPSMNQQKIIVGGGFRFSNDNLTGTPLVTFTNIGEKTSLFSSFVQDKITLVPENWFLTLGTKFEHNDYTGFELEPNARLQWHIDDKQMAWTSVSRAVRTPSRLEEDLNIIQATNKPAATLASLDSEASPGLQSEELIAYELGYRRQLTPAISADTATFYNIYHGLSTLTLTTPSGAPFFPFIIGSNPARLVEPFGFGNNTAAETWGIETNADWRVVPSWKLSASYSLLVMRLYNTTANTLGATAPETQSPNHQANLRSQWDISKDVSYDTMFYYTSEVPNYNVKAAFRLDMRLAWRITDGVQFSLVGQDLLDPSRHEFSAPSPTTGVLATSINRTVYGNVTWRF